MLKRSVLLLALPLALSAQEDPFLLEPPLPSTVTRVAVGGYDQAFSDGGGHWKGWVLEGTIYPPGGAPWQLSAAGFDRPEGKGTLFSVGKHLLIGEASAAFLGLNGGTNGDILPLVRADLEFRFDLGAGWKVDVAGALSRFTQDQEIRMLQVGPAYQGRDWSISARVQQLTYDSGGEGDTGGILNLRFGNNDFGAWHNLRLAAGRGILESTASGGGLSANTTALMSGSGSRFGRRSTSSTTPVITAPARAADPLPQERLASLTGHWPLTDQFAIKAEATWGEKVSTYHFWGGSLQVVISF